MALKLYNTLTREKDEFEPLKKGEVSMYTCGPTVYDFAHIGNFRAYVCSDILKRYLKYRGYKVKHVMNITDVDDKTIRESGNRGISLNEYTQKFTDSFFEDLEKLNIDKADIFPRATEHIKEMVEIVKKLQEKGLTYNGEGSTYYRISRFKDYGRLSKINMEEQKEGASQRVDSDEYEKESAHDFVLWKCRKDNEPFWDTELGKGRPGWHIECSAMSMKYLGESFDIHTGGIDLIFPHHENEIAQSEGATGKPFVKYWVHNEYLFVNGKKMSKSLGNFFTLRDLLEKGHNPTAIRYLLLSAHYRTPLNFTEEGIKDAQKAVEKLVDFTNRMKELKSDVEYNPEFTKLSEDTKLKFEEAMDNDLNISEALGVIFEFVHSVNRSAMENKVATDNAEEIHDTMLGFDKVLGILEYEEEPIEEGIEKLAKEREEARKKKDWATADKIRDQLKEKGYVVEDTPEGPKLKRI